MRSHKGLTQSFLVVLLSLLLVQTVDAAATTITIPRGEDLMKTLRLSTEDHVSVKFTVVGQTQSTLDFSIIDPQGDTMIEYNDTGNVDFFFICNEDGEYKLRFSNKDTSEDKLVALNYEIQHYIFGMPQMLFLTIVIVAICLVAVASFILMGKRY